MANAKNHHYIPQFLLRHFSANDKEQLYVFDKQSGTSFIAKTSNIATISKYYDFDFQDDNLSLEPGLAKMEEKACQYIRRIIKEEKLSRWNVFEKAHIARFMAIQLVRTPAIEKMMQDFTTRLENWLRTNGMPEKYFTFSSELKNTENAERVIMARNIYGAPKHYARHLLKKDWILFEADRDSFYQIGDHPVAMHNMIDRGPRGNLGLGVTGIEVYLPLSKKLTLGLICSSHRLQMVAALKDFDKKYKRLIDEKHRNELCRYTNDFINAIKSGRPIKMNSQNVKFFNSLQTLYAERFIFSSNNDFSITQEMIKDHPELKHGRRMEEATGKF